ncbi:MAG TPA: selenocysteine-specific translation elongation factor [Chloroflexota bacterium]|nr:selenocysteine-specific translation elongation factor [Chloroflexota bacterium]
MPVIATAGHIDHGKSALVTALTGTNPDRLPEEKTRGMTIDLGFAWLDLGDGQVAGVVDVPGHERFIRHMLAGVGGIDLALLVVAADEVIMPQTREHLAILDLLEVQHGVVALTKRDLVDDEWLTLAIEEVRATLADTSLRDSPIVPCSSRSGQGLAELRAALAAALASLPTRADRGQPRLPIDRVFTLSGHGTVVTGALLDGAFNLGQEVEVAPSGRRYRIRALQSHQRKLEQAKPGSRVAINLAGAEMADLTRGMVVCLPGALPTAWYLDLRLRAVGDRARPHARDNTVLAHNQRVTVHVGAAEVAGTVRLLDRDTVAPGEEGWAQIRLAAPLGALRGDHCVLRVPSPAATVAGGVIVAVNPPRHARMRDETVRRLEALAAASPEERILDALAAGPLDADAVIARAQLPADQADEALTALARAGRIVYLTASDGEPPEASSGARTATRANSRVLWSTPTWLAEAARRGLSVLKDYHHRYPLRRGMPVEALRAALGLERRTWGPLLTRWRAEQHIGGAGDLVWEPGHRVVLNSAQELAATRILAKLAMTPYAPGDIGEGVDFELVTALIERGDLVRIAEGVVLGRDAYKTMRDATLATIDREGQVTVALLRDQFSTSRKYAQALLEHLDDLHVTRRVGDGRVRGPAMSAS